MSDYYGPVSNSGSGPATVNDSSSRPPNIPVNTDAGKIFVGGLSWQTTEESLRWHFEQYGSVVSVEVMRDRHTGDPRGFAFVVFADHATVDLVMDEDSHEINHKIVDVKRAQARGVAPPSIHGRDASHGADPSAHPVPNASERPNPLGGNSVGGEDLTPEQMGNKVFVGGIPPHIDRDGLRDLFEPFGAVTDAIVMMDQTTMRSRCFGFVTFEDGSNGAQKAVDAQPLQVQGRRVEVKLATPRAEQPRKPNQHVPAVSNHVGLRAGIVSSSSAGGKYAGLAVAYGRNGWKAGYGSKAFGAMGWAVQGWDDGGPPPERSGFSFALLHNHPIENDRSDEPPFKRSRRQRGE
jgi:RNA recognition motif-containing protein